VLGALELAEKTENSALRAKCLRFVIVGGGPTGVELAGAIRELASTKLSREFKRIDPRKAEVYLIEASSQILPPYEHSQSLDAKRYLENLGVTVKENAMVTQVSETGVTINEGGHDVQIEASTVIWSAGVQTNGIGKTLAKRALCDTGPGGRIKVNADFSLPSHPDVFVIGDLAYFDHEEKPLPGIATAAQQAGKFVAQNLFNRNTAPFKYHDQGQLAVIGRNAAVGVVGQTNVKGRLAWWLWLAVHVRGLIGFDVKLKVMLTWAWKYLFGKHQSRLITKSTHKEF
jgi:NADH dehydrogenase